MDITVAEQIDTFSFSGTITEDTISGDWTVINIDGDYIESSGEMTLGELEDEGIIIEMEEDEVFRGDFVY